MLVMGHLHPALPVRDAAGAGQKLPVFLATSTCVLLPAFSPFAGGYDLLCGLPEELLPLFGNEPIHAVASTGKRAAALGELGRLMERTLGRNAEHPASSGAGYPALTKPRQAVDGSPGIPYPAVKVCPDSACTQGRTES